jgi:phosphoribosylanthranilate isomerase
MGLIVKTCGLSTPETVDAAIAAGADMIGFVFFPKSPRYIDLARAADLAARARGRTEITALAVDMDDAGLAAIMDEVKPDWLQLHGSESVERVAEVRQRFPARVMKVVGIREAADVATALGYRDVADRLLLDAKPPKGATRPGGNAVTFDWRLLKGFEPGIPWMLSGGLDPGNVAEAICMTHAPGVDASSGLETAPGVKSPDLIRAFIAAARRAALLPERIAS